MRSILPLIIALTLGSAPCGAASAQSQITPSPAAVAAVSDTTRPASDTARDANRKPAETLTFIGLQPGDRIADYASGSGYFSRLFAAAVGPQGHVYASVPLELLQYPSIAQGVAGTLRWALGRSDVTITLAAALNAARYPEALDVFWIGQNYHDLYNDVMGPVDIRAFNQTVFDALKPGGVYVILDHVAAPGSPREVTGTLHRIEASQVRSEVEAAGFVFESQSDILANPADNHSAGVFDETVRGRTDQFLLKFRKPGA